MKKVGVKMRLVKFEKAYKIVLHDSRGLRKLGAYAKVGDYRDAVNDACLKVLKKFGEELYELEVIEIVKLLWQSLMWVTKSKMRYKKDLASQYFTNYLSEFENFDITFKSNWLEELEFKIDSDLNDLPNLNQIIEGFDSRDYIDKGIFSTKRKALYQTAKQKEKYRELLLSDGEYTDRHSILE